jgi:hypothetical protein
MCAIKWTGSEFSVVRRLVDDRELHEWMQHEGAIVVENKLARLRLKWFFGRRRARDAAWLDARDAIKPGSRFAEMLNREIDELPKLIRQIGTRIRKRRHRDLYTINDSVSLVVVPRAIVRNELSVHLTDKLLRAECLAHLKGLPMRVIRPAADHAERLFFEYIAGGQKYLHTNRRAAIMGADGDFNWRFDGIGGHYFCAYTNSESSDLSRRDDLKAFQSGMKEVIFAQTEHLKHLSAEDIEKICTTFRGSTEKKPSPGWTRLTPGLET